MLVFVINHMKIDSQYYLQITSSYLNIRPLQRIQIRLPCRLSSLSISFPNQRFYYCASRNPLSLTFAAPWWKGHTDTLWLSEGNGQPKGWGQVWSSRKILDLCGSLRGHIPHPTRIFPTPQATQCSVPVKPVGIRSDRWRTRGSRVRSDWRSEGWELVWGQMHHSYREKRGHLGQRERSKDVIYMNNDENPPGSSYSYGFLDKIQPQSYNSEIVSGTKGPKQKLRYRTSGLSQAQA